MPQSIPFDPSLVLGNIVDPKKIKALEAVDAAQEPVNLAQEKLNSLILSKGLVFFNASKQSLKYASEFSLSGI